MSGLWQSSCEVCVPCAPSGCKICGLNPQTPHEHNLPFNPRARARLVRRSDIFRRDGRRDQSAHRAACEPRTGRLRPGRQLHRTRPGCADLVLLLVRCLQRRPHRECRRQRRPDRSSAHANRLLLQIQFLASAAVARHDGRRNRRAAPGLLGRTVSTRGWQTRSRSTVELCRPAPPGRRPRNTVRRGQTTAPRRPLLRHLDARTQRGRAPHRPHNRLRTPVVLREHPRFLLAHPPPGIGR